MMSHVFVHGFCITLHIRFTPEAGLPVPELRLSHAYLGGYFPPYLNWIFLSVLSLARDSLLLF